MATPAPKPAPKAKGRAAKAVKDPNRPRRPSSAYMFFSNEQRSYVVKENPDLKFGEIGKVLGEMWKVMTDADKSPYATQAEQDKIRYNDEMAAYTPPPAVAGAPAESTPAAAAGGKKPKKVPKPEGYPKSARNAFNFFSNALQATLSGEEKRNWMAVASARWKALGDEDKTPYNSLAAEDKERYSREMAEWNARAAIAAVAQ